MKILLIEEDKKLNNSICEYLTCKDFKIVSTVKGESVISSTKFDEFNLCVLSNSLSDIHALEILKKIKNSSKIPVIMLSKNDDILEFERAFYCNCDEYMRKPFHLKELELRIYKLLNITHIINIHDDLIFNLKTSNLYYKDRLINLRKKEKFFLNILVSNRGNVVHKDKIIEKVWNNEKSEEYPIRQLVSKLREKLPTDIIKTETGLGYKIY